jgi:chromatin remodeling complex protein RSC6
MPTPKKAASPKNALSKPVQPDAALAAVVGKDPLPRTELTKKLWEYIRKHELQDPKEKRNIAQTKDCWRYSTARRSSRCSR